MTGRYCSQKRQQWDDNQGTVAGAKAAGMERLRMEREHQRRSDAMTDNCEEQALIREYVRLYEELKCISSKLVRPASDADLTVYEVDGKHYQLLKRVGCMSYEIPVMVRTARVVRSLEAPCSTQ